MGTPWEGYSEQERFYFPALEVGEVVPLTVPGNTGNSHLFITCTYYLLPVYILLFLLIFVYLFIYFSGKNRQVNITTLSINPKVFMLDPFLSQEVRNKKKRIKEREKKIVKREKRGLIFFLIVVIFFLFLFLF